MSNISMAYLCACASQNRIETAQTSESLTEVVNMARRRDAMPEPETGEATPITAPAGNEKGVNPPRCRSCLLN